MRHILKLPLIASALLFIGMVAGPVQQPTASGQVITLHISGTYNTLGGSIFGESGTAVPYSYTMDYDTSLDTNTFFYGVGQSLGGRTTTHEWYGYSTSGILSSNFTFGTKTFSVGDIDPRTIEAGVTADFWTDVDLATGASPNATLMYFNDITFFEGLLEFSSVESTVNDIFIDPYTRIFDFFNSGSERDYGASFTTVPEPNTFALAGLMGIGLLFRRRRRV